MEAVERAQRIYEFSNFRLIPSEGLLLESGAPIVLPPKAFAVLAFLVQKNGHLVSKSEIMDRVWDEAFVEEVAVAKAVSSARRALGDSSKEKFIQTIPKRGYRFVAPVRILNDPAREIPLSRPLSTGYRIPDSRVDLPEPSTAMNGSASDDYKHPTAVERRPSLILASTYVGVALLVVVGLGFLLFSRPGILGAADGTRIAVLPLVPVDVQKRDGQQGLGITEQLIFKLAAEKKLSVRQLSTVRRFDDPTTDAVKAGEELKVDYVVAGNYQVADGRIKVTAQLIDIQTGKVEETFPVEYEISTLFAVQERVANDIGSKLLARFGSDSAEFKFKPGTDNEEAYRSYQHAMVMLAKSSPVNRQLAIEALDKALALDPAFARAWAGKAYAHAANVWTPHSPSNREEIPKSMDALQRALSIDPNLSEAQTVLCENRLYFEFDPQGAEAACKKAVELDPNSSLAHLAYSKVLTSRSRFDEALSEVKTALDQDPASFLVQRHYANVLYHARRYSEAEEQYRRAISLNPQNDGPYERLIRVLEAQERQSEAFPYLLKLLEIDGYDATTIDRVKTTYSTSGWSGAIAERIKIEEAEADADHFNLAGLYADVGNKRKAFENLEKAFRERHLLMTFIRVDNHHFDEYLGDPRFESLVRQIEGE